MTFVYYFISYAKCGIRAVGQVVVDQSLGQDVGKVVHGHVFHLVGVCNVVLHELPTIRCAYALQGGMQTKPAILCQPKLLKSQVMLPCLVMIIDFGRVFEVAGQDGGALDSPRAQVAMFISPSLQVGIAIKEVGHS